MSPRRAVRRAAVVAGLIAAGCCLAAGFWIPVKARIAQILLERAWHAVRAGNEGAKPWPWADTTPVGRLSVPELDVAWIVLSGASGRNLAFAPAHVDGSAAPGEPGVTIIAGHRDTHFEVLQHFRAGTQMIVEDSRGEIHRYQVTRIEIVDSNEAGIRLDAETPMLVLATCYPFNALTAGGPLRYVVQARALEIARPGS